MNKNEKLADRLELLAKISRENGKGYEYQIYGNGTWHSADLFSPLDFVGDDWEDYELRLVPQPVMVPLDSEDIPPGSAIRKKVVPKTWETILFLGAHGIINHEGVLIRWDELYKHYEIKQPGEDWKACNKEKK